MRQMALWGCHLSHREIESDIREEKKVQSTLQSLKKVNGLIWKIGIGDGDNILLVLPRMSKKSKQL